jgi:DNA-binding CsgD family transcriptional regulator
MARIEFDDFSRIVSSIYAAAGEPESWVTAMSEVRTCLDARSSALILADSSGRTAQSASLPPEAAAAYNNYYCRIDYVLEAVENGPVGLVRGGRPLIALKQKSEFDTDWMRPHQMDDGLFVRLTAGPSPACFLVASPMRDDPFDSAENIQLISAVVPHLQQALRTQKYFEGFARAVADTTAALDSVSHGVLVVDAKSVVLHTNKAAEAALADNDGLTVRTGQIGALTAAVNRRLTRAIADAVTGVAGAGTSMLCPRPSGKRAYVVHVLPQRSSELAPTAGRALVAVIDPERMPQPDTALLRRLYGLTPAEAQVAIRVLRGDGLKPISEELEITMATVKTHLQHVFDKTDTHRQAELVRLLLAVTR